jgi:raffinose/stachyose/melibiose transport system permease protein
MASSSVGVLKTGAATAAPAKVAAPGRETRKRRNRSGYLYLLPGIALLGLFIVYPLVRAGIYSFDTWNGVAPAHFVGGYNWEQIFENPIERGSLVNAGILFVFYAFIPVIVGLAVVSLLSRFGRRRGMGIFRVIFFLPQVTVTVVIAIVWTWILAPIGSGSINGILHDLHLGPAVGPAYLGDFSTALLFIGLIGLWIQFGLCFVLFLSGVQRIPTELYDAARIDGAGLVREFVSVTVPMLRREIGAAITISVVASLQSFPLIYQATDGGPGTSTTTPGLLVYRDAFQLGQVGTASALGIGLAVIIFALTFGVRAILERRAV